MINKEESVSSKPYLSYNSCIIFGGTKVSERPEINNAGVRNCFTFWYDMY